MMLSRISLNESQSNKERQAGVGRGKQLSSRLWLGSVLVCAVLLFFAFPALVRACRDFMLEISAPDMARAGDAITYTIRYQNVDWPLLTDVVLTGPIPEYTSFVSAPAGCQLDEDVLVCWIGTLTYGQGGKARVTLRVNEGTPSEAVIVGKVKAVSKEPGKKPVFLNSAQGYTDIVAPALSVTNQPSKDVVQGGEQVTYTYTVTNTGDVALTNVTIRDDQKSPPEVCPSLAWLQADQTFTCTWTTALEVDTTNVATATGLDPWGDPVTDSDSAFVRVAAQDAALSVTLTASAPRVHQGDVVTYTYVVSNTGADMAYNVVLRDDAVGEIGGPFELAGGESVTYIRSVALAEDTTNVVTATGQDNVGQSLVATGSVFVDTIQQPGPNGEGILALTISPSATSVQVSTVVTYTFVVTNVSQDAVHRIVVLDDQFGYITMLGEPQTLDVPQGFTLQAGESRTLTLVVPIFRSTRNVTLASGQDLLETVVSAEARAFVRVLTGQPLGSHVVFLPLVFRGGR